MLVPPFAVVPVVAIPVMSGVAVVHVAFIAGAKVDESSWKDPPVEENPSTITVYMPGSSTARAVLREKSDKYVALCVFAELDEVASYDAAFSAALRRGP